jgi:beta-glucanase (GH16 family)
MSALRRALCGVLALMLLSSACQVARRGASEVRLSERRKNPPPLLEPPAYEPSPDERLPSELREQLGPIASLASALPDGTFSSGRSYRLELDASAEGAVGGSVAIKFREPKQRGTYRTYSVRVASNGLSRYTLELTAPAYVAAAELAVDGRGGKMAIASASLKEIAPLPRTMPVTSWAGSFVPEGYALVFNDEFSGTALDRRRWFTRYIYGSESLDRLNDENQRYTDNDNHRVQGGTLSLVARKLKRSQPSGINFESGMIRSDFTARYGFYEARVKMPSAVGTWAAFWLNSDVSENGRLGHPPEIDFFEFVNNGKDDKVNKIHSAATRTPTGVAHFSYKHQHFIEKHQDYRAPFDFDDAFHTIGTEWTPTELTLYVDGLKIYTRSFEWKYKDGELAGPAHVLFNLAVGGQWAGRYGIDDDAFPQALVIDWVRVYQKPTP